MWDKSAENLLKWKTAVLNGIDASGYPYSVRCLPRLDATAQVIRLDLPGYLTLQPGPASLLSHSHNEQYWDLKMFNLRGVLERDEQGWHFRPTQVLGGMGASMGALMQMRRTAKNYLTKRGLARPKVPWAQITAAKQRGEAKAAKG